MSEKLLHTIDLGRVVGLSAKDIVERHLGLEPGSLTDELFIEAITGKQGEKGEKGDVPDAEAIRQAVKEFALDDIPIEGSESLILSGGVYNGLYNGVGALDDIVEGSTRFPTSGAVWRHLRSVVSHSTPTELTAPLSKTAEPNTHDCYTTKVKANYLEVTLPANAEEGDTYQCDLCSLGEKGSTVDFRLKVEDGGILLQSSLVPTDKYAVRMEAKYSHLAWHCDFWGYDPAVGVDAGTEVQYATIVYSGANREATADEEYEEVVKAGVEQTISTEHFQTLYGKASILGWTTDINGTEAEYENGGTITLSAGETKTLYPVYSATTVTVAAGSQVLLNGKITEGGTTEGGDKSAKGSVKLDPSRVISGFTSGTVDVTVGYRIYVFNVKNNNWLKLSVDNVEKARKQITDDGSGGTWREGTVAISSVKVGSTLTANVWGASKLNSTVYIKSYTVK